MRIFEELQKSKGIDSEVNGFYQYAKCYKVLLDDPNHGLFMEDLTSNGFQPDKFEPDFEYAKVTMETLAKFHALSFALKVSKQLAIQCNEKLIFYMFRTNALANLNHSQCSMILFAK